MARLSVSETPQRLCGTGDPRVPLRAIQARGADTSTITVAPGIAGKSLNVAAAVAPAAPAAAPQKS